MVEFSENFSLVVDRSLRGDEMFDVLARFAAPCKRCSANALPDIQSLLQDRNRPARYYARVMELREFGESLLERRAEQDKR